MTLLGNLLWILLGGGLVIFVEYVLGGVALCLTIVGIPFGIQCMKLGMLGLLPFGRQVVEGEKGLGCLATGMNVLWILLGGIWIALTHLVFAVLCAVTIIGLPFAAQHVKLATLALVPFGKEVRRTA